MMPPSEPERELELELEPGQGQGQELYDPSAPLLQCPWGRK